MICVLRVTSTRVQELVYVNEMVVSHDMYDRRNNNDNISYITLEDGNNDSTRKDTETQIDVTNEIDDK